jgi:phosphoglycolate phosphatase-like HAD superfamily hydrolase
MSIPQNVLALVFDFDDTLTDDSTTQLLVKYGVDPEAFWNGVAEMVKAEWDPTIAFLQSIFELTNARRPLAGLSNAALREFGKTLKFYQGLPGLFDDLKAIAAMYTRSRPGIEAYVISGGFEEIIRGSSIAPYLSGIWGCRCIEDPKTKTISGIRNIVDFTLKTRYLFEINKGLVGTSRTNPFLVNLSMEEAQRRIPFENMIYCGDGLTDVAAFSLLHSRGGTTFALFNPTSPASRKRAAHDFLTPHRVTNLNTPRFESGDDLGALLRMAVTTICDRLEASFGPNV